MPDKGKQLYDALSANPKYKNLGKDYDSFKEHFSDPENASKLYSAVSRDPKFKNVGKDVDAFTDFFGLKKKSTPSQPIEASSGVAGPASMPGSGIFEESVETSAPVVLNTVKSKGKPVIPVTKSNLGLGVPTTGLGSSLTNAGSFGDMSNLPGRRTASEKQLDSAMSAFSGAQGADASQEINEFSVNRPQEQVSIDTENKGSRVGYIGNKLLQGVGSLASGLVDIGLNAGKTLPLGVAGGVANDAVIGHYRKEIAPVVRDYFKNKIGFEVDKGAEATYDNEFITSALGGLAQSVPAMASGYTGLMLQGFDFGMQAIQNADPEGKLDEGTKTIYASGLGLITSALEKVGLDKIMKGNTTILSKLLFDKAVRESAKKTGGKVTGDILEQYINDNIKGVAGMFAKGGARAIEGFMVEATTGASQEVVAIASEDLLNRTTGESIFDTSKEDQWNGFVNRVAYAGAQEGVGGFVMGPFFNGERKAKVKTAVARVNAIDEQLDNPGLTPPAVEALTRSKIQIQDEIENEAVVEQAEQAKLSPEALKRAGELEEDLNNAEQALADPELSEDLIPEIQSQIDAMNKELAEVVAKPAKTPTIKPNDLVNYTDTDGNVTQVPVESVDGETLTVGVNKDGIYSKVEVKATEVSPISAPVITTQEQDSEAKIAKEAKRAEANFSENDDQVTYVQKMAELDKRAQKLPKTEVKEELPASNASPKIVDITESQIVEQGDKILDAVVNSQIGVNNGDLSKVLLETLTLKENNELYNNDQEYRELYDQDENGTLIEQDRKRMTEIYRSRQVQKQVVKIAKLYDKAKQDGNNPQLVAAVDQVINGKRIEQASQNAASEAKVLPKPEKGWKNTTRFKMFGSGYSDNKMNGPQGLNPDESESLFIKNNDTGEVTLDKGGFEYGLSDPDFYFKGLFDFSFYEKPKFEDLIIEPAKISIDGNIIQKGKIQVKEDEQATPNTPAKAEVLPKSGEQTEEIKITEPTNENIEDKPVGNPEFQTKQKAEGRKTSIRTPDGTKIEGQYRVVSADDVLASHNEETFSQTENFPTTQTGTTVNDRDYGKDRNAQGQVVDMASNLDGRAISDTPVVDSNGIVLSGNNRTMSRKLAATNKTDGTYLEELNDKAEMYGVDPEAIKGIKNPMIVFQPDQNMPYTTETFAKFNKATGKEKGPIEKAIEIAKTITDKARRQIANVYENATKQSDITSDPKGATELKDVLISNNIIEQKELPRYFDVNKRVFTKEGVAFLENLLMGGALNEGSLRALDAERMGDVRKKVIAAAVQLTSNSAMGANSLADNISKAINLANEVKKSGLSLDEFISQGSLFGDKNISTEDFVLANSLLNGNFKSFLENYNANVGSFDMFAGKERSKKDIVDDQLNKDYGTKAEQIRKNLASDTPRGASSGGQDSSTGKGAEGKSTEENPAKVNDVPGVTVYRGQQKGQKGNWFTTSKEFAQKFAGSVQGNKKSDGEVVEYKVVGNVFDFPHLVTDMAKLSDKLADIFGVTLKQLKDAIAITNKPLSESEVVRIHSLLENKGFQELLSKNGYDYIKAKESLTADQSVDTFLKINDKSQDQLISKEQQKINNQSGDQDAKIISNSINPLPALIGAVNKFQEKYIAENTRKAEDWIAGQVNNWLQSKNYFKRNAGQLANAIFNGIPRSKENLTGKLELSGGLSKARYDAAKLIENLYAIVGDDLAKVESIHQVIDPDFYIDQGITPTDYNSLSKDEQLLHDQLRSILDDVHRRNFALGFIDQATYDKFKGKYSPRLYETNEIPSDVQDMLDNMEKYSSVTKLDMGQFKSRKELEDLSQKAKDDLLKDPVYGAVKRLMQLDQNAAIAGYINQIMSNTPTLVKDSKKDEIPKGFQLMSGKGYGKLDGKYVPNYIAEDFKGFFMLNDILNKGYDFTKGYDRFSFRQFLKKSYTVYNPVVQLGNFVSNFTFAFASGIDPVTFATGLPKAYKELQSEGADFQKLMKAGILGSDTVTSDLIPAKAKQGVSPTEVGPVMKALRGIDNFATKAYAMSDNIAKMNAFLTFKNQGLNDAAAIQKVYEGFQNYATVGKMWDVASKTPFIGAPFVKFQADLLRIIKNGVTKTPLTTSMYIASLYAMPQFLQMAGISDEEEEDEKELRISRDFIPKVPLGITDIPLVYKTKFGEVNLARYLSPFYLFDTGNSEGVYNLAKKLLPVSLVETQEVGKGNTTIGPSLADPLLGTLTSALFADTDFRGKSIKDPESTRYRASGATTGEQIENKLTYLARSWVPQGSNIHDFYLNQKYGEDFYGRTRNTAQGLINMVVKVQDWKDGDYKKEALKRLDVGLSKIKSIGDERKNIGANSIQKIEHANMDYNEKKITKAQFDRRIEEITGKAINRLDVNQEHTLKAYEEIEKFIAKYQKFLK